MEVLRTGYKSSVIDGNGLGSPIAVAEESKSSQCWFDPHAGHSSCIKYLSISKQLQSLLFQFEEYDYWESYT